MKKLRIISLSLSLIVIAFLFVGCTTTAYEGEPKTFTKEDLLSITLTDQFEEKTIPGTFLSAESTGFFNKVTFAASSVYNPSGLTVKYVVSELIHQAREEGHTIIATSEEHFEFTTDADGTTMYFYDLVMKKYGKTYLFEFACKESQKDEYRPYFIEWASTIVFD